MLSDYWPPQVRQAEIIERHPVAPQIASTVLANDIANLAGPGFFVRLEERTGALLRDAAAFAVAREVLGLGRLWTEVDDPNTKLTAAGRLPAPFMVQQAPEAGAGWLLRNRTPPLITGEKIQKMRDRAAHARTGSRTHWTTTGCGPP